MTTLTCNLGTYLSACDEEDFKDNLEVIVRTLVDYYQPRSS